jgi:hypothetical protein
MKTKMKNAVMLALLLMASPAFANMQFKTNAKDVPPGGLVGNGGGTVVCRNPDHSIKSIELLDYYESILHTGMQIDIQTIPGDWKAKAAAILNRVRAKSELHYQLYSLWLANFESEWKLIPDMVISTVPDSGYIGVPNGCEFEQAAVQRKPIVGGDPRYYISADLWSAMDDNQKAGLVLHEIIYREAIAYGHTDSIRTRYLNGLFASTEFQAMSFQDYVKALDEMHFELVDVPVNYQLQTLGLITSTFDPTRLWQSGPDDQTMPKAMMLSDRYLARIGRCDAPDCGVFTSYRSISSALSGTTHDQGIVLPGDLNQLKIDNTILGGNSVSTVPISLPANLSLEGTRLLEGLDSSTMAPNIQLVTTPMVDTPNPNDLGFGAARSDGWMAFGITGMTLTENAHAHFDWVTVQSASLYSPESIQRKEFLAIAVQKCALIGSTFTNGVISKIILAHNPWACGELQEGNTIFVSDFFANGLGEIGFSDASNANDAEVIFDSNNPGKVEASADQQWDAINKNTALLCDAHGSDAGGNCLNVNSNDARAASGLWVYSVASAIFCGAIAQPDLATCEPVAVELKINQKIPLYPNGSLKSFTVAGKETITFPATPTSPSMTVGPGSFVTLDKNGFILSVK